MTTTNHLGMTLVEQAQAQKEVTVNQALTRIDAILNCGATTQALDTPPGSPVAGDLYIVAPSSTGTWSGHDGELAYFDQSWRFIVPNEGMSLWVNDEDTIYTFDGSDWISGIFGESNTASNLGSGDGIYASKSGVDLRFKSLVAGTNITLTPSGTEITIDASGGGGGYATVQEEGSELTARATLNFVGAGFTAADDAGNTRTNVTLDATLNALAAYNTNGLITQTAADTFTGRTLTGGGGITVTNGNGVSGNPTLGVSAKCTISIPAAAIRPSATGGCANIALVATTSNRPDMSTLDFDATTAEYAQFWIAMPKGWDESTVTAQFLWSHASTVSNFGVRWGLQGVAVSNDDTIDVAYGTAQEVTDTGGTTSDLYISDETSAITLGGSPATGDMVCFRVYRDPTNGGDTMTIDARLHAVKLYFTIDTIDDA